MFFLFVWLPELQDIFNYYIFHYQHFRKRKCPYVNILENYIINQDILKDLFADGFVTDELDLTDEMYTNAAMHDENGAWQMIFGVNTLPDYRKHGYAGKLICRMASDAAGFLTGNTNKDG